LAADAEMIDTTIGSEPKRLSIGAKDTDFTV